MGKNTCIPVKGTNALKPQIKWMHILIHDCSVSLLVEDHWHLWLLSWQLFRNQNLPGAYQDKNQATKYGVPKKGNKDSSDRMLALPNLVSN
jgi:hypothetical protein